jgi:hypothetical protein
MAQKDDLQCKRMMHHSLPQIYQKDVFRMMYIGVCLTSKFPFEDNWISTNKSRQAVHAKNIRIRRPTEGGNQRIPLGSQATFDLLLIRRRIPSPVIHSDASSKHNREQ